MKEACGPVNPSIENFYSSLDFAERPHVHAVCSWIPFVPNTWNHAIFSRVVNRAQTLNKKGSNEWIKPIFHRNYKKCKVSPRIFVTCGKTIETRMPTKSKDKSLTRANCAQNYWRTRTSFIYASNELKTAQQGTKAKICKNSWKNWNKNLSAMRKIVRFVFFSFFWSRTNLCIRKCD